MEHTPSGFSDRTLAELVEQTASIAPTPGAGPSVAWTCALAAALVEMVSAVALRHEPPDPAAVQRRRERARALRDEALEFADRDAAAHSAVLAVLQRRAEPGHGARLRESLSHAADPPVAIAQVGAEVTRLAAEAASEARGGVRGEAMTAAVLGEATVRAMVPVVDLNLGGSPEDPRRALVADLARRAGEDLRRAPG
jgi:methenyltetrahydrofolate cyclohydrolase